VFFAGGWFRLVMCLHSRVETHTMLISFPRSRVGIHTVLTIACKPPASPAAPNNLGHWNSANARLYPHTHALPDYDEYNLFSVSSSDRFESVQDVRLLAVLDKHGQFCGRFYKKPTALKFVLHYFRKILNHLLYRIGFIAGNITIQCFALYNKITMVF